ncbi:MAG: radical SAM protein, partial [Candidatus Lokiarchaeota archaeon]|nr:radical SAM protein [Candidatus Lokiarchaeota archaeon]
FKKKVKNEFHEMGTLDILKELYQFIENINFKNNPNANCVFRTNHASNYLPIGGILDQDKFKILKTIKKGIENPSILRPESYRAL